MKRNIFGRVATFAAVVATVAVAQPAAAQYELNITGSVNVSNGLINPANLLLDFLTSPAIFSVPTTTLPGAGPGVGGTNLSNVEVTPLPGNACATCPQNWFTIGGYTFNLQNVPSPAPSGDFIFGPVSLVQGVNGVNASMSVRGEVTGPFGGTAPFTRAFFGTVQATFAGETIAHLVGDITAGGTRNVGYSADLLTAVPEPSTYALMATGIVALVGVTVRRRRMDV
jgi:hypothetical protein